MSDFKPYGWLIADALYTRDPEMADLATKASAACVQLYRKDDDAPDTETTGSDVQLPPHVSTLQPVEITFE